MKREVSEEDLIAAYKTYPRKRGRTLGLKKAMRTIHKRDDLEALKIAIENYKKIIEREGTEDRYVMYFSTFMNQWEDFLDEDALEPAQVLDLSSVFGKKEA